MHREIALSLLYDSSSFDPLYYLPLCTTPPARSEDSVIVPQLCRAKAKKRRRSKGPGDKVSAGVRDEPSLVAELDRPGLFLRPGLRGDRPSFEQAT